MKKALSLVLALCMVFALVACGGGSSSSSSTGGDTAASSGAPATSGGDTATADKPARGNVIWTFGTADTGGSMYPAGAAVSQTWTNNVQGMKCNTQTSTGSFQNVQDVASGEVDVAVATADVVLNGFNGTGKFADIGALNNIRVIGAVYTSVLSGVTLKSSGLKYVHDLAGKRVAVGPASSATENASLAAFDVMGISKDNTSLENLGLGDGADAVGDGILDAAFGFAGLPIGGQLNLAATKDIAVLDLFSRTTPLTSRPRSPRAPTPVWTMTARPSASSASSSFRIPLTRISSMTSARLSTRVLRTWLPVTPCSRT